MRIGRYLMLALLLGLPLLGMVARQLHILNHGSEVALEIVPVDPRSLFRGDYVRLNYAISRLNTASVEGDDDFSIHDDIHVLLAPEKNLYVAKGIFQRPPAIDSAQVIIKGKVSSAIEQRPQGGKDDQSPAPVNLSVRYGIETYFVPEGTGRELEQQAREGSVSVLVAVLDSGEAAIKGLRVNNKNHYINPL